MQTDWNIAEVLSLFLSILSSSISFYSLLALGQSQKISIKMCDNVDLIDVIKCVFMLKECHVKRKKDHFCSWHSLGFFFY